MNVKIDEQYVFRVLADLVRIDSVNPMLVPGATGERALGSYIAGELAAASLEATTWEVAPGRVNVVGVREGSGGGRSLMFNGHMDTVGVEGMEEPFGARVRDGRLYGRGAQDMKGGLAAMLGAVKALADGGARLGGDVIFAAVADEEFGSLGTEELVERYTPEAAIVAEPTDLEVCVAHKGFCVFEIETRGRAAHGARYMEGIDANISAEAEIARVVTASASKELGRPPSFIGHHWWEDAALIAASGAETVIVGTKGGGIHTHEEWVDLDSVTALARILADSALTYCS